MLFAITTPDGRILAHARDLEQAREKRDDRPGSVLACADHPAGPFRPYRHLTVVPAPSP